MIASSDQIGIGITTKNRWDDLEVTLTQLQNEGLDRLETLVMDDCSATPMPARFEQQFPWVRFMRTESSAGLMAQRNRLFRLLSTPFILGLDDDSYPVAGSIEAAMNWMAERPKVAALAFQVLLRQQPLPPDFAPREPFPVRDYIGCATMIRRDLFVTLGGYEERFGYYVEEAEYCLRAIQQGYEIQAYPSVVIRHHRSPIERNLARRQRYFTRNEMLLALWYFPFPKNYLRALRTLPAILIKRPEMRKYWWAALKGYLEGPVCYLTWPKKRKRLTFSQFYHWKKLPMATEVVEG
jgi:GT2 family glycosyltransferase